MKNPADVSQGVFWTAAGFGVILFLVAALLQSDAAGVQKCTGDPAICAGMAAGFESARAGFTYLTLALAGAAALAASIALYLSRRLRPKPRRKPSTLP